MSIEFALTVAMGESRLGLFDGTLSVDKQGFLIPGLIESAANEAEAFASCWRAQNLKTAARVGGLLLHFGPPMINIEYHEIRREECPNS